MCNTWVKVTTCVVCPCEILRSVVARAPSKDSPRYATYFNFMLHSCICVQSFLYFIMELNYGLNASTTQRLVDWVDGLSGWLVWAVVIYAKSCEVIHVLRLPLQVANNKQVWHVHTCRLVTLVCVHESLTCSGYCMVRRVVLFTMDFLLCTHKHIAVPMAN